MRFSLKVYRLLLRLYPAGFRESYGAPLERQFKDEYADAASAAGVARFWLRTLWDFAVSWPPQLVREVRQDARHAFRSWRRSPLPILFAIATLAIAVGANTGVFSVLNALLLRSLPFREPDRVASVSHIGVGPDRPTFHAWRQHSSYLEDGAAYNTQEVNLDGTPTSIRVRLTETTWNFFQMLGSQPLIGRTFAPEEDTAGRNTVAVIGYGLWLQLSGGDPRLLGSTLRVNGTALTIVGVAPPGFDYPLKTALWSPTTFDRSRVPKTDVTFFNVIGRLKPGLSWAQARSAFAVEAYNNDPESRNDPLNSPALTPIQEQLAGPVKHASLILMAGVALLLLMACASIANLLIGRTASRSNELAIRIALGASRARLIQQLLTESVLLAATAAIGGLLVARWTAAIATATQPAQLAGQAYTILDWRVLGFTAGLAFVAGVAFGLGPVWFLADTRAGAFNRTSTPTGRVGRIRNALIAAQIALSIVLFTGSVALGRAFLGLVRTDQGFQIASVATLNVALAGTVRGTDAAGYYSDVLRRIREVPGVSSASATQFLPLGATAFMAGHFDLDNEKRPSFALLVPIAPGYFHTIGAQILYGRDFDDRDLRSEPVAIVNDEFARIFGDPSAAIGRSVSSNRWRARRIVGVVKAMRYGPASVHTPEVYSLSESPQALTIVARVNGSASDRIAAIRDAAQSVDPKVPVFDVKTMQERVDTALARPKLYTTAIVFFGGLALLLVVIGIYGVVSYAVVQRTREMGIRLALGITPSRLRAALLRHGFLTVALGVVPGVWAAIAVAHSLESLVKGAESGIVTTSVIAALIATSIAGAAIWSATRRIALLDVMDVLRAENAE